MRRPALAAADVGHARRRLAQAGDDVGHRRQPLAGQLVGERGPVDVALAVAELDAVGLVGHAAAGAVRLGHAREHAADAGQHVRERRDVRGVVGVGRARGRARRAARSGARRRVGVVDLEEAGDRLLLEPLARVARGDAGALGQLGRA